MASESTTQEAGIVATPEDVVVRACGVSKMYSLHPTPLSRLRQSLGLGGHSREFWALNEVDFAIRRGEIVAVVGRNGSGKSTLLQLIAGVLRPNRGEVHVRGRVAALLELGSGFNPEFTGRENVFLNGAILGLSREQIRQRMDDICAFAGIGEFVDQPVKRYSSGMFVRLAFSVATHVEPQVLLVDEALSVGDAAFRFKCLDRMEKLLEGGTTVLLVTHDVHMLKAYCTRAIYLRQGRLVADGDTETVTEQYLMEVQDAEAQQVGRRVTAKPHTGGAIRFGSDLGEIADVRLLVAGEKRTWLRAGERATVYLRAHVKPEVKEPTLLFQIRDRSGQPLYGLSSHMLRQPVATRPDGTIEARFDFDCQLQRGSYSVIVQLGEWLTEDRELPIDRQTTAVVFEVVRDGPQIIGVCDLRGTLRQDTGSEEGTCNE